MKSINAGLVLNKSLLSTGVINPEQVSLHDNLVVRMPSRIFAIAVGLKNSLQNAYRVERQAKRFYAMSDTDLGKMGISREEIPAHLAKAF